MESKFSQTWNKSWAKNKAAASCGMEMTIFERMDLTVKNRLTTRKRHVRDMELQIAVIIPK